VIDLDQIGPKGYTYVTMDYSGLSTFVDQFKVATFNGDSVSSKEFPCYQTSAKKLYLTDALEPGVFWITVTAKGQGKEITLFKDAYVIVNPRMGGSSVTVTSAASGGFA
jgi:hypothetical protein